MAENSTQLKGTFNGKQQASLLNVEKTASKIKSIKTDQQDLFQAIVSVIKAAVQDIYGTSTDQKSQKKNNAIINTIVDRIKNKINVSNIESSIEQLFTDDVQIVALEQKILKSIENYKKNSERDDKIKKLIGKLGTELQALVNSKSEDKQQKHQAELRKLITNLRSENTKRGNLQNIAIKNSNKQFNVTSKVMQQIAKNLRTVSKIQSKSVDKTNKTTKHVQDNLRSVKIAQMNISGKMLDSFKKVQTKIEKVKGIVENIQLRQRLQDVGSFLKKTLKIAMYVGLIAILKGHGSWIGKLVGNTLLFILNPIQAILTTLLRKLVVEPISVLIGSSIKAAKMSWNDIKESEIVKDPKKTLGRVIDTIKDIGHKLAKTMSYFLEPIFTLFPEEKRDKLRQDYNNIIDLMFPQKVKDATNKTKTYFGKLTDMFMSLTADGKQKMIDAFAKGKDAFGKFIEEHTNEESKFGKISDAVSQLIKDAVPNKDDFKNAIEEVGKRIKKVIKDAYNDFLVDHPKLKTFIDTTTEILNDIFGTVGFFINSNNDLNNIGDEYKYYHIGEYENGPKYDEKTGKWKFGHPADRKLDKNGKYVKRPFIEQLLNMPLPNIPQFAISGSFTLAKCPGYLNDFAHFFKCGIKPQPPTINGFFDFITDAITKILEMRVLFGLFSIIPRIKDIYGLTMSLIPLIKDIYGLTMSFSKFCLKHAGFITSAGFAITSIVDLTNALEKWNTEDGVFGESNKDAMASTGLGLLEGIAASGIPGVSAAAGIGALLGHGIKFICDKIEDNSKNILNSISKNDLAKQIAKSMEKITQNNKFFYDKVNGPLDKNTFVENIKERLTIALDNEENQKLVNEYKKILETRNNVAQQTRQLMISYGIKDESMIQQAIDNSLLSYDSQLAEIKQKIFETIGYQSGVSRNFLYDFLNGKSDKAYETYRKTYSKAVDTKTIQSLRNALAQSKTDFKFLSDDNLYDFINAQRDILTAASENPTIDNKRRQQAKEILQGISTGNIMILQKIEKMFEQYYNDQNTNQTVVINNEQQYNPASQDILPLGSKYLLKYQLQ